MQLISSSMLSGTLCGSHMSASRQTPDRGKCKLDVGDREKDRSLCAWPNLMASILHTTETGQLHCDNR